MGFVSQNKHAFEITIKKKWPENQTDTEEDTYESPQLVSYKDMDTLVPMVKISIETTIPMLESWSDNDEDTLKDMMESSMVHNEIT